MSSTATALLNPINVYQETERNRWLIALSAVGIHICIGSVYAWSVLVNPIIEAMGWGLSEVTFTFSLAILFLGLSAGTLGKYAERMGPTKTGLYSMMFFTSGLMGTALALKLHSLPLLYLSFGVVGGIGLGLGYIAPVSTLVKYFPKNKGFATGLAIMGFGFASLIAAPLMQSLVADYGLVTNFLVLGGVYAIVMTASSLYLAPPKDFGTTDESYLKASFQPSEAYATKQFKLLWVVFFFNIACGIALLAVISPMAQEVIGMDAMQAASFVGIIGVANGLGRIFWASASDYLGRGKTYCLFFLMEVILFGILSNTMNETLFMGAILLIVTIYGGGFSCMPAYLSDMFGGKNLSTIHGRILTAWGFAGIAGPILLSNARESLGGYSEIMILFSGIFILNLMIATWINNHKKVERPIQNGQGAETVESKA